MKLLWCADAVDCEPAYGVAVAVLDGEKIISRNAVLCRGVADLPAAVEILSAWVAERRPRLGL